MHTQQAPRDSALTPAIIVSDVEVRERFRRIRFVMDCKMPGSIPCANPSAEGPCLHLIERRDQYGPSAGFWLVGRDRTPTTDLEPLAVITTRHKVVGDGSFDPEIREFLEQIPEEHAAATVAIGMPHAHAANLKAEGEHHVVRTTLYRRKVASPSNPAS